VSEAATILVVDDVVQNVRLLEAVLAPRGYTVIAATSGAEALERLGSLPVDLVLLDILMPGLNGYEVLKQVRANPALGGLPVIFISAFDDMGYNGIPLPSPQVKYPFWHQYDSYDGMVQLAGGEANLEAGFANVGAIGADLLAYMSGDVTLVFTDESVDS